MEDYKVMTVKPADTEKKLITSNKSKYTLREAMLLKELSV